MIAMAGSYRLLRGESDPARPRCRGEPRALAVGQGPDSSRARTILADAGLTASKSKGQNFLTQGAIADRIVASANLSSSDDVIEIGPGLGILTERILRRDIRSLTVVELDHELAERLRKTHPGDAERRGSRGGLREDRFRFAGEESGQGHRQPALQCGVRDFPHPLRSSRAGRDDRCDVSARGRRTTSRAARRLRIFRALGVCRIVFRYRFTFSRRRGQLPSQAASRCRGAAISPAQEASLSIATRNLACWKRFALRSPRRAR